MELNHCNPTASYRAQGQLYVDQILMGRYSSVGIATRYGHDGPGIEPQWRRAFLHPSKLAMGPTQYTMGTASFPGVKRPGRGVDHPPSSSAGVKERVDLYLCSSSGTSWQFIAGLSVGYSRLDWSLRGRLELVWLE